MNSKEMRQEIEEAMEFGEAALENLRTAQEKLENVGKWAKFDVLSGGSVTSVVKMSKMKDLQGNIELAKIKIRCFEKELKDICLRLQRQACEEVKVDMDCKVLILDEPSNGLDPAGIKQLRDILKNLAHNEGVCVLVSSHLMSEMELMCDRVGIIAEGKLLDIKTIDDMTRAVSTDVNVIAYHVTDASKAKEIVDEYVAALDIDEESKTIYKFNAQDNEHFDVEFPVQIVDELWKLNKKLAMADVGLISICPQENRKLEDVFIEMTANGGDQIA